MELGDKLAVSLVFTGIFVGIVIINIVPFCIKKCKCVSNKITPEPEINI